jgi:hypothetical protein
MTEEQEKLILSWAEYEPIPSGLIPTSRDRVLQSLAQVVLELVAKVDHPLIETFQWPIDGGTDPLRGCEPEFAEVDEKPAPTGRFGCVGSVCRLGEVTGRGCEGGKQCPLEALEERGIVSPPNKAPIYDGPIEEGMEFFLTANDHDEYLKVRVRALYLHNGNVHFELLAGPFYGAGAYKFNQGQVTHLLTHEFRQRVRWNDRTGFTPGPWSSVVEPTKAEESEDQGEETASPTHDSRARMCVRDDLFTIISSGIRNGSCYEVVDKMLDRMIDTLPIWNGGDSWRDCWENTIRSIKNGEQ